MNRSHVRSWWLVGLALTLGESRGDEVVVEVEPSPGSTIAAGQVDLTGALRFCKKGPIDPAGISGHVQGSGEAVPVQFVPGVGFDPRGNVRGLLLVKTSGEKPFRLELKFGEPAAPSGDWDGRIERAGYELKHERGVSGGMPRGIVFKGDGKRLETLSWNNRLHHRETGSFFLAQDDEATVERIASGPLCETVRVSARFVQGKSWPASEPKAVYHWHYLREEPLVLVEAAISQREAYQWHEVHFLEPNYRGEALPRWAGGDPEASGSFTATRKSFPQRDWGVVHDGRNAIGMFDSGQVLLYDGGGATYIQARGDEAWSSWDGLERRFSGWVWLGAAEDPPASVRPWADRSPTSARMRIGVDSVNLRLETAERASASLPVEDQRKSAWRFRAARQLAAQGKHDEALATAEGDLSPPARVISAGDLNLVLDKSAEGLRVLDLFDAATGRGFVTETPAPLFTIQLRDTETKRNIVLTAENGWGRVDWSEEGDEIIWSEPKEAGLEGLAVLMECNADVQSSSLRCGLSVKPPKARFGLWRVAFPGVEVADLGDAGAVFYPQAAGIVRDQAWGKAFRFGGTYPSGWVTMQYMAAYDKKAKTGLYLGVHDPWGSTKDLLVESRPSSGEVVMAFDHPVPGMGVVGSTFELPGEAVFGLLRGDWFDAATTYRDWVRREARWYPKMSGKGREDTPSWMRDLPVWALSGGTAAECVPEVKTFAEFLGVPAAVHWYNWHQIPFDNDYPHYFPTKEGFTEGVRQLQSAGVAVMPYINGRLWDTLDQGQNDREFTSVALAAVSKNEQGEPYVETYGSKEADGRTVRLGVMCPSTALWKDRLRDIVLRLMNENEVKAVYMDQIAAASPTLCFDKSHGHPIGGGHWWTQEYWNLLSRIREAMPADRALTTECNGEPYVRYFDGYLTWHWQYDGQVPAFPAVYGGAIAMFGRSYGGGPTRDLALRMRAGQSLVFGEQIGWIAPAVINEAENAGFFREIVQIRSQLTEFFREGEMARPPLLKGEVGKVKADWRWGGQEDWVTTDSVITGAWRLPATGRLAVVFVNVSDSPVTASIEGMSLATLAEGKATSVTEISRTGRGKTMPASDFLASPVTFPPRGTVAWEIGPR